MKTGSSNAIYAPSISGVLVRMPDHLGCQCDQCLALDASDSDILKLVAAYLGGIIGWNTFREEHVLVIVDRPHLEPGFTRGPVGLDMALESLLSENDGSHPDALPWDEARFKRELNWLIYGYEIRMRSIHEWKEERNV